MVSHNHICTLVFATFASLPGLAAWKLLGDVLVQHHAVDPSPSHPSISVTAVSASGETNSSAEQPEQQRIAGLLEAWRRRMEAMQQGQRAYAKALHLDPGQPGSWQDAAFAYYHEAQVCVRVPNLVRERCMSSYFIYSAIHRRMQVLCEPTFGCCLVGVQLLRVYTAVALRSTVGSTAAPWASPAELFSAAERMTRAGLRLNSTSADLWAALGTVAAEVNAHKANKYILYIELYVSGCWSCKNTALCGIHYDIENNHAMCISDLIMHPVLCSLIRESMLCQERSSWIQSVYLPGLHWRACIQVR